MRKKISLSSIKKQEQASVFTNQRDSKHSLPYLESHKHSRVERSLESFDINSLGVHDTQSGNESDDK